MTDYGHDMLFGSFIEPLTATADAVVELAELAENAGLDLVTFQDHPYQPSYLDTWTLMSYVAARTERIRLSGNVLNAPLRPPATLARAAASLDLLSNGRFEMGIGAGAYWDAIAAMGGPRYTPGEAVAAFEESIDVMRQIWTSEERGGVRGRGHHAGVRGAKRGPEPAHEIAVWVGALKPRMLDLIGRVADGWLPSYPYLESPDVLRQGNERIDAAAVGVGRAPEEIRRLANISPADADAELLARLTRDYGISAFILMSDDPRQIVEFGRVVAPAAKEMIAAERTLASSGGHTDLPVPPRAAAAGAEGADAGPSDASSPSDGSVDAVRPPVAPPPPTTRLSSESLWDETVRPEAPEGDGSRPYTDLGRQISDHFKWTHDHLRSELESLRNLAAQVLAGDVDPGRARSELNAMTMRQNNWALNAYCAKYCATVTQHHSIEDASIFPHLRRSEPGLQSVIDRLSSEHVDIHELLDQVDRAMVEFVTDPATGGRILQDTVDLLTDTLLSHLAYEERQLLPAITRHGLAPGQLR